MVQLWPYETTGPNKVTAPHLPAGTPDPRLGQPQPTLPSRPKTITRTSFANTADAVVSLESYEFQESDRDWLLHGG